MFGHEEGRPTMSGCGPDSLSAAQAARYAHAFMR